MIMKFPTRTGRQPDAAGRNWFDENHSTPEDYP